MFNQLVMLLTIVTNLNFRKMKKVFSIFMVLFLTVNVCFAFGVCGQYAEDAADAEQDAYGFYTFDEWKYAYNWYYAQCAAADGNIGDPVFL
jgi:hypothetical protein